MSAQEPAAKLTGDEYMQLLTQRMNAFMQEQQRKAAAAATGNQTARLPLLPPLLEWFIRAGDEDLVELPEPPAKPKPQPRYYRPASYWRERITQLETQMSTVSARASVGDRAAAGGCALGPKRTALFQKRADAALTRYIALEKKLTHAQWMLRSAEARESAAAQVT